MAPTSERATACVSAPSLCVTEWGNPPSLQLPSSDCDVNGDIQGKGGEENRRDEPGGKGCAIIRSLRGGMHSQLLKPLAIGYKLSHQTLL